jgi:carboxymethylenebutenolidase
MAAALDALAARSDVDGSRVGVTGFCMGGLLTFLTACALPDRVKAAAPFYGGGIASLLDRAGDIQAPLHLFFGAEDAFIPLDQVKQIDAKLGELGKAFDLDVYDGAQHGFFCDERGEYNPDAAKDAWGKLTRFFAANLGG